VTGDPADRHVFKVPSLRNVALTAPYFHDGSIENLDEAIATMAFFQLGRRLELQEIEAIEAFLWSLTGELRS
jgi:cytochrome c peroxidase